VPCLPCLAPKGKHRTNRVNPAPRDRSHWRQGRRRIYGEDQTPSRHRSAHPPRLGCLVNIARPLGMVVVLGFDHACHHSSRVHGTHDTYVCNLESGVPPPSSPQKFGRQRRLLSVADGIRLASRVSPLRLCASALLPSFPGRIQCGDAGMGLESDGEAFGHDPLTGNASPD
jgi:hypothetical protein